MAQPKSAAGQIWPHLPHDDEPVVKQSRRTLAESLWPSLSREAKVKDADQTLWNAIQERQRQRLRQGLREWREGRR
jgi:hypothetical protein